MANRRNLLVGSGAAVAVAAVGTSLSALFGASGAMAQQFDQAKLMAPALADHPLGNKDAKVTVIEYLSPSCPHCKDFQENVLPQLKAEYVDTNKIQFIPRPFVRNVLDAVVFMLAEAAGPEKYHGVIETYFKTQDTWLMSNTPNDALFAIAQQLGFTQESYDTALKNQDLYAALDTVTKQARDEFKLPGTPAFYINGKLLAATGDLFGALKAEIDPLLS